jgi:DNA-binding transcriptional ArsR family regulator
MRENKVTDPEWSTRLQRTASAFRALADPARLEIIRILTTAVQPLAVREIGEQLGLPQATTSYHLKQLRQADLLVSRPLGTAELHELSATGTVCSVGQFWT